EGHDTRKRAFYAAVLNFTGGVAPCAPGKGGSALCCNRHGFTFQCRDEIERADCVCKMGLSSLCRIPLTRVVLSSWQEPDQSTSSSDLHSFGGRGFYLFSSRLSKRKKPKG
ncbi:unnamed protein product, partial [Hapterophycus canaliculatus]